MSNLWILFGLGAALALGAANIPQKLAVDSVNPAAISPFAYGVLAGAVIIVVNLVAFYYYGDSWGFTSKREWGFGLLAALLFAIGSLCIAVGFRSGANASQFVALFNTNTLIATVLGLVILKEFGQVVVWKVLLGAVLVVAGGLLVVI